MVCIVLPLVVGGLSALLSGSARESFDSLIKPPLSPPGWLFPVAWTVLYILMGVASYLVLTSEAPVREREKAIYVYLIQLAVNFFWSIIFFNLERYLLAFIWLVLLWSLILATLVRFYRVSETAGRLMIPYLLWVTFAGYLNFSIYLLN